MPVTLSICIPTYNRAALLANCLRSVAASRARSGASVEVCVSDNGSTDGTLAVVEAASREMTLKYRRNEANLGVARNIVDVVAMAEGEFVWLLGDDDLLLPDAVDEVCGLIEAHPKADYFFVNSSHAEAAFVLSRPQPFDTAELPKDLEPFSKWKADGETEFFSLIDPRVSFDFLLAMFLSVFRRESWARHRGALDESKLSDTRPLAHFDSTAPHVKIFARAFARSKAVFRSKPVSVCLKGAREWAPMYPLVRSVRLVEALEQYRQAGLPLWRYLRCRNFALKNFLPDLANMFVHRAVSGWDYVSPLRLLLSNCWLPNFYLSPLHYAARKLTAAA